MVNHQQTQSEAVDLGTFTDDALLDEHQAAAALHLSAATLRTWRCRRTHGPAFVRLGRACRYRAGDLRAWINGNRVTIQP